MLSEFLSARALERDSSKVLFTAACEFLRAEQVVRPGVVSLLERVGAARDRAHGETWVRLAPLVTAAWRTVLDGMLVVDAALGGTRLEWLCRGPTVASARTIHGEIAKLSYLRSIGADRVEMSVLPLERLRFLAGVGRRASPAGLRRREPTRRYPIVFATVTQAADEVLDELVGLFDQTLSARESHARARLAERLAERGREGGDREVLLNELLARILDDAIDDEVLGGVLRHEIGMERMRGAWAARRQPLPRRRGRL